MILCILFLMECACPSQNLISDVQLLWNIENSNKLPQQLKHTRTKFYIYVIPESEFHGSTYTSTLYQIRVPDGGGGSPYFCNS
jgi:hypothetical protein